MSNFVVFSGQLAYQMKALEPMDIIYQSVLGHVRDDWANTDKCRLNENDFMR